MEWLSRQPGPFVAGPFELPTVAVRQGGSFARARWGEGWISLRPQQAGRKHRGGRRGGEGAMHPPCPR